MLQPKRTKVRQLSVALLVAVFVLTPLRLDKVFMASVIKADESSNEHDYFDEDGYEYINGNVTWGKGDHIIEKALYISDGGTLNIEKGARILFKDNPDREPYINVGSVGRIVANGTQDEKIVFSSTSSDGSFGINIDTYTEDADVAQSFFRYVDFFGTSRVATGGSVSVFKSLFINTAVAAEYVFSPVLSYGSGEVHIENSTFHNGSVYVNTYIGEEHNKNGFVDIVNSNFELDGNGVAVDSGLRCYDGLSDSDCKNHVSLKNDWYGNASGPLLDLDIDNPSDRIIVHGKCELDGWRKNDMIADPVILVPGITGSSEVLGKWELDPILHIYDDLIASFKKNGYEEGKNFFEFPYNWRKSNVETAGYLKDAIEVTKNLTKVSKVDVVAHSMGGLVARSYIEGESYGNDIDQLIAVATPHHGSPESYLKWEAGEGFFTWEDWVAQRHFENEAKHSGYDDLQKYIQDKVVSVRELLPDYDYLFDVSNGKMRSYPDNYPTNSFLENLNDSNNVQKLKGVDFINIVGKVDNDNSTISKIRVVDNNSNDKWKYGIPENFDNKQTDRGLERDKGDETVPIYSSTSIKSDKEVALDASHQEIPKKAQCEIIRDLTGKTDCEYVDDWHIDNILLLDVFSPIDIQIISPSGKKYGKDFENNKIFESVDGSYYTGFDTDNEFITIPNPEDGEYRILTQGTGDGEYRVEASKISEDQNDPGKGIESTAIINGVAKTDKTEELKVEVKGNDVVDENAQVDPPIVLTDDPEIQTPPVVPAANQNINTNSDSNKNSSHSSSHKKKKHKKKKKKAKKSKISKVVTQVKKVLGVSTSKSAKQKTVVAQSWNYVAKSGVTIWGKIGQAAKTLKDFLFQPFNYFKKK